jgi:hypothetical protein
MTSVTIGVIYGEGPRIGGKNSVVHERPHPLGEVSFSGSTRRKYTAAIALMSTFGTEEAGLTRKRETDLVRITSV